MVHQLLHLKRRQDFKLPIAAPILLGYRPTEFRRRSALRNLMILGRYGHDLETKQLKSVENEQLCSL
jgi:hypothetical protein